MTTPQKGPLEYAYEVGYLDALDAVEADGSPREGKRKRHLRRRLVEVALVLLAAWLGWTAHTVREDRLADPPVNTVGEIPVATPDTPLGPDPPPPATSDPTEAPETPPPEAVTDGDADTPTNTEVAGVQAPSPQAEPTEPEPQPDPDPDPEPGPDPVEPRPEPEPTPSPTPEPTPPPTLPPPDPPQSPSPTPTPTPPEEEEDGLVEVCLLIVCVGL